MTSSELLQIEADVVRQCYQTHRRARQFWAEHQNTVTLVKLGKHTAEHPCYALTNAIWEERDIVLEEVDCMNDIVNDSTNQMAMLANGGGSLMNMSAERIYRRLQALNKILDEMRGRLVEMFPTIPPGPVLVGTLKA